MRAVNTGLIEIYKETGKTIHEEQESGKWKKLPDNL